MSTTPDPTDFGALYQDTLDTKTPLGADRTKKQAAAAAVTRFAANTRDQIVTVTCDADGLDAVDPERTTRMIVKLAGTISTTRAHQVGSDLTDFLVLTEVGSQSVFLVKVASVIDMQVGAWA